MSLTFILWRLSNDAEEAKEEDAEEEEEKKDESVKSNDKEPEKEEKEKEDHTNEIKEKPEAATDNAVTTDEAKPAESAEWSRPNTPSSQVVQV